MPFKRSHTCEFVCSQASDCSHQEDGGRQRGEGISSGEANDVPRLEREEREQHSAFIDDSAHGATHGADYLHQRVDYANRCRNEQEVEDNPAGAMRAAIIGLSRRALQRDHPPTSLHELSSQRSQDTSSGQSLASFIVPDTPSDAVSNASDASALSEGGSVTSVDSASSQRRARSKEPSEAPSASEGPREEEEPAVLVVFEPESEAVDVHRAPTLKRAPEAP